MGDSKDRLQLLGMSQANPSPIPLRRDLSTVVQTCFHLPKQLEYFENKVKYSLSKKKQNKKNSKIKHTKK